MESLLIVCAICLDSLSIGIAYGIKGIEIPKLSIFIINMISICFLFISMFCGNILRKVLPENISSFISFLLLLIIGVYFILEWFINFIAKNKDGRKKKIEIKFSNIKIIIDVKVNCMKADINSSGAIDPIEAIYLGIALSLDSLAVGFGSAIGNVKYLEVIILSFIFNILAIIGGIELGEKLNNINPEINFSWLSGAILIFLGILKIV